MPDTGQPFIKPSASAAIRIALVVAVLLLIVIPLPAIPWAARWPQLFDGLENFAHPVLFFVMARATGRFVRGWPRMLALAAVAAAMTEVIQSYTGRDASLVDLCNDLLGASAAILVSRRPMRRWAAAGLCMVIASAPLLWVLAGYVDRSVRFPILWEERDVFTQPLSGGGSAGYPGHRVNGPWRSWEGYSRLRIVVANRSARRTIMAGLRIADGREAHGYTDRFNTTLELEAGSTRELVLHVQDVRGAPASGPLDLTDIRDIVLFEEFAVDSQDLRLLAIRLER